MSLVDPQVAPLVDALAVVAATGNVLQLREFLAGGDLPALGGHLVPAEILQRGLEQAPHLARQLAPLLADVLTQECSQRSVPRSAADEESRWVLLNGVQLAAELPSDPLLFSSLKQLRDATAAWAPADRSSLELPVSRALVYQQTDASLEEQWFSGLRSPAASEWTPTARTLLLVAWRGVLWLPPARERVKAAVDFERIERGLLALLRAGQGREHGDELVQQALDILTDTYPRSNEFWQRGIATRIEAWPRGLRQAAISKWPQIAEARAEKPATLPIRAAAPPRSRLRAREKSARRDSAPAVVFLPRLPASGAEQEAAGLVALSSAIGPAVIPSEALRAPEDAELLYGISRGDIGAFERFFELHSAAALGLLFRMLGSRGEAEEVLQEAFLHVWRAPDRYDPHRSTPRGWLLGLARSRALDRLRRRESRSRREHEAVRFFVQSSEDAAAIIIRHEEADRIASALTSLSAAQRQCIELSFFESLTHTQIAARLGIPLGSVKSYILRGLNQLRHVLAVQ